LSVLLAQEQLTVNSCAVVDTWPNCIYVKFAISGMRFGLMQTKVGLVSLLSKYQISVSEKTPIPLVMNAMSFIPSPVGGMWLKINSRNIDYEKRRN
jgi:hypothetical protein